MRTTTRRLLVGCAVAAVLVAGCSSGETAGTSTGKGGSKKIALLLPESETTRYESFDRPLFEARVKELCKDCEVVYSNANQDETKQQSDAEAALAKDIAVMVLDPVNGATAGAMVQAAKADGVPVISYDRLIVNADVDYYISFDNEKVGQLQGQALVDKLSEDNDSGNIVMINGSPTDNNATLFKKGAHSVIDSSPFKVVAEYDTVEWKPENAQQFMDGTIAKLGKDGFVGVYAANDGTAGGAIAAMKSAGIAPIPPITGQDAELAAIQRIVSGEQYMTVYKALKPEAEQAAELAIDLVNGEKPATDSKVDNQQKEVPSILLTPVVVTVDKIMDTVVADEFYTVDQICTGQYADACTKAGIQ